MDMDVAKRVVKKSVEGKSDHQFCKVTCACAGG